MERDIITVYCLIDEYLKVSGIKDDVRAEISNAEVLLIGYMAVNDFSGNYYKAHQYSMMMQLVKRIDYTRFLRRLAKINEVLSTLFLFLGSLFQRLNGAKIYSVDSFPVELCQITRQSRVRLWSDPSLKGYNASKGRFFYGLKVHMVVTTDKEPVMVHISEGSIHDVTAGVALHPEASNESHVIIDSTAQEKHITYPTDGKLAIKMIHALHKIAKREGIALRRTYLKEIKEHRITLRFFRHPKKKHKARSAMKRLRTIAGIVMRDMQRSFTLEQIAFYAEQFSLYTKVLLQKRSDKDKIYSLHEPHIYAMAKGKDHKSYEFGVKASVVTTYTHGIVVGAVAHESNEHDSKTLKAVLTHASTHRHTPIQRATCDRGYRGIKEVNTTHICIPGIHLKRDTKEEKEHKRKQFRRRAAIEPTIGHLKHDHRMARNYLKGFIGDQINLLMAACAWNLKKWMNLFIHALFLAKDYRQMMVSIGYMKLYWSVWIWLGLTQRESRL